MRATSIGACVLVTAAVIGVRAQTTGPSNPPLVIQSMAGADLFAFYCPSCHGRDGGGDGAAAAALKTPPPDLRLLARHNGGTFPRQRVEIVLTNDSAVHAARLGSEMPAWGPVFRGLDASDTLAAIRMAILVRFIETMQMK